MITGREVAKITRGKPIEAPSNKRDGLEKIVAYYSLFDENGRLAAGLGRVEIARTQEIIRRHLPPPPGVVLDVGGAAGRYSCWLAAEGYEAHLVDPVPAHVGMARKASARQPEFPVAGLRVGDARRLDFSDAAADAVLLMGPLYHLVKAADRLRALREAHRVLKAGGLLFAVGITRFASALEAVINGFVADDEFATILFRDLRDGQHRNPTRNQAFFTDAYFHRPEGLRREVKKAGFDPVEMVMVDPFAYSYKDIESYWDDPVKQERLMDLLRRLEREPSLMGAGPHLMCVARKPA